LKLMPWACCATRFATTERALTVGRFKKGLIYAKA